MERKDWALLAIASGTKPLSPAQLQKSLFLLGKRVPRRVLGTDFYRFKPYNYGPFDVSIYHDAEDLAKEGLVAIAAGPGTSWDQYSVTLAGRELAAEISKSAPPQAVDDLRRVVEWAQSLDFADLVRAIYHHYPGFRKNSVFLG